MNKRKCEGEEYKNIKRIKLGHRFEPELLYSYHMGNFLLQYYSIEVEFYDYLWPSELRNRTGDTKKKSEYRINRWFIDDNGILRVDAFCTDSKEDCDFPAIYMMSRGNKWKINLIDLTRKMPKTTLAQLGYNKKCSRAQERSDEFANLANKYYQQFGGYIFILDGTGRNLEALLKIGIPASKIILIDRELLTSLYHRLLSHILGESFITYNTGEFQRHAKDGIENMMSHNLLPYQEEITCAYFDFDCDVPTLLVNCILSDKLPNLRLLGITQAKRNVKTLFPEIGQKLIRWNKGKIRCQFSRMEPNHNEETELSSQVLESKETRSPKNDDMRRLGFEQDPDNPSIWIEIDERTSISNKDEPIIIDGQN